MPIFAPPLPPYFIVLFNLLEAGFQIPDGGAWLLCDGTNGTPDLRPYFLVAYETINE